MGCRDCRYLDLLAGVRDDRCLPCHFNSAQHRIQHILRTFGFFALGTNSPPSSTSDSSSSVPHTSYRPLCFAASLSSSKALPAPTSVVSMTALNGPFRGRLPIRKSLSLSSCVNLFRLTVAAVARDTTAGTADRCARILVDVRAALEYFGRLLRTTMIGSSVLVSAHPKF